MAMFSATAAGPETKLLHALDNSILQRVVGGEGRSWLQHSTR